VARVEERPPDAERGFRWSVKPRGRKYLPEDVLTAAIERMHHVYDLHDHVAVGFSGGKDSTVCLEIAVQVAEERGQLPLRVVHFDEEAIPFETERYVRRWAEDPRVSLDWLCLPVKHRNGCSRRQPWWWPWASEAEDLWVRPLPPEAITSWPGFPLEPPAARLSAPDANGLLFDPKEHGRSALVMGIRAEESIIRQRAVTNREVENWIIPYSDATARGNCWKVYPIYDWRTADVWTAIDRGGWDYNEAYDLMELYGMGHRAQRCAPPYGEEPIQILHMFSRCFPDVWDRMAERVPGAKTAARYARTALYDFHARRVLPEGVSWPEYIVTLIDRFPEEERSIVADGLRTVIAGHYKWTSDPILPETAHPASGVCWSWLASRAARGNFKRRRQPNGMNTPAIWAAYHAELRSIREEGREWEIERSTPA
jgi:predicted phosphoadenosine phosphosulfate sulfurtransferase